MASARKYPSWHEIHRDPFQALARIKLGLQDYLYLGNLDAKRDWGHARDFVEAQWLMLQHPQPEDFVIANGEQHSVREFVEAAARELGITIVDDQIGAPTWCRSIAEATAQVLAYTQTRDAPDTGGTYHLSAAGSTSWCGFARTILEYSGSSCKVTAPAAFTIAG